MCHWLLDHFSYTAIELILCWQIINNVWYKNVIGMVLLYSEGHFSFKSKMTLGFPNVKSEGRILSVTEINLLLYVMKCTSPLIPKFY
jgi:hypothetical protein